MKLGTENKKSVYALSALGVVAAYMVYSQFFSGPTYRPVTPQTAAVRADGSPDTAASSSPAEKRSGPNISQASHKVSKGASSKANSGEFHPVYLAKKVEDRPDVTTIDPTIRFDRLDRVLKVPQAGSERDLFQISKTPPVRAAALASVEPTVRPFVAYGPRAPLPPTPVPPPPPPSPLVIPFKFYGTSAVHPDGTRTAYFISPGATPDLDEIYMANEGDLIKNRYRIVQIGVDRVTVEDTHDKRSAPLNMEKETQ